MRGILTQFVCMQLKDHVHRQPLSNLLSVSCLVQGILSKYNVSDADYEKLMEWRHQI